MKFGIEKCVTAAISKGKLTVSEDLVVSEDTVPIVIGSLGSISMCLAKHLQTLNIFYGTLISKLYRKASYWVQWLKNYFFQLAQT